MALVAGVAMGSEAPAATRVELHLHGDLKAPLALAVVLTAGEGPEHRLEAIAPGTLVLPPLAAGRWRLQAEAEGAWSAPLEVEAPAQPQLLDLHLWPETRVRATLQVPRGSTRPAAVTVRLQKAGERRGSSAFEPITLLCPVDGEGRMDCRLPRLRDVDLRLRSPGFASRFFWDLALSAASAHDLGEVPLRPGASVVGRLEVPPGHDVTEVVVRLRPARSSPHAPVTERVDGQSTAQARPDERGFFSLEGLAAGAYDLAVRHPSLAALDLPALRVVEGAQTEIAEPLLLAEPAALRLLLSPPFDPHGKDWRLELLQRTATAQARRVSGSEPLATTTGFVEVPAAPGAYEARIFDSRGVRVASHEVTFDGREEPYPLEVEPILVDGRVTLGEDPILARVTFRGPQTVQMDADLEGRFGGYLPRAGEWDVEVHAFDPPVNRRTRALEVEVDPEEDRAVLHLRLPDTTLRGTVVDPRGVPVPDAEVTVTDPLFSTPEVRVASDEEGGFRVRGLDEGAVLAQAARVGEGGREWSSRPETGVIREDDPLELRLVLREHARLRGRVVAADGNPLPGAWIETLPYTAEGWYDALFAPARTTDAAGRFDSSLPRSTAAVHLVVLAPGHPLTSRVLELGDHGDLVLGSSAGSLAIELPAPGRELPWHDPAAPRPTVVTPDGTRLPLGSLAQWAALNGQPWDGNQRRVVLPLLAPGSYAVCWLTAAEWMARHARGRACVQGEVAPGTDLVLTLPPPPGAPAA
ncbi:MAG TPA: carboxypeptidase regulatory-like domain-containing protein [Thermoanaerobaculia bacterium]|nr:carboxypeptidase regulatory-like domain-containing protein [Thermoanaerobaculia bacterium]